MNFIISIAGHPHSEIDREKDRVDCYYALDIIEKTRILNKA